MGDPQERCRRQVLPGVRKCCLLVAMTCAAAADAMPPSLVLDIHPGSGAAISEVAAVGDSVYFAADDGTHGAEPWKSNGFGGGTALVKDINPGGASAPAAFVALGGVVLFTADDGTHGRELWRTDGTAAGTEMVADIYMGGSASPQQLTVFSGAVYFSADDGTSGRELWKSDGTEAGTVRVADIDASTGSFPQDLAVFNNALYFSASDVTSGQELRRTAGSGAVLVSDIWTGGHGSPQFLTSANGFLFFSAVEPVGGRELWRTNGTEAGTLPVKDLRSGTSGAFPMVLTPVGNVLYFSADDGVQGRELWRTNGTDAGTECVSDIVVGAFGSNPQNLTALNGLLYFTADDGVHGRELWRSNGVAAGTTMVKDIRVAGGAEPRHLVAVNGLLYFQATDDVNGRELWVSNGTDAGTELLHDIQSGIGWSSPEQLVVAGSRLFFVADDGVKGPELWAYLVPGTDMTAPVISLIGGDPYLVEQGTTFSEPGYIATDNVDGDITENVSVSGAVNANAVGTYTRTYSVSDTAGNDTTVQRTVEVLPSEPPEITLLGDAVVDLEVLTPFLDPGATAIDNVDGDLTDAIVVDGSANMNVPGQYELTYRVSDAAGNEATPRVRTVNVADTTAPVITVVGDNPMIINQGTKWANPGATAFDNLDGNLTHAIVVSGSVNTAVAGEYGLLYSVSDTAGNEAVAHRIIYVVTPTIVFDPNAPNLPLSGWVVVCVSAAMCLLAYRVLRRSAYA